MRTDRPLLSSSANIVFLFHESLTYRAPGGSTGKLRITEKFNRHEELPVGTQFVLIEQTFLISDKDELLLSPLVFSISLRAYVGINPHKRTGEPVATQNVAEFLLQPRQLMRGNAVMKALASRGCPL